MIKRNKTHGSVLVEKGWNKKQEGRKDLSMTDNYAARLVQTLNTISH